MTLALSILPAMLAFQAAVPLEDLAALETRMAAEAGAPLRPLDPRLRLRRCPEPATISHAARAVAAACPALGWRVYAVPLESGQGGGTAANGPAIRRGDAVALRVRGRGYAVVLRTIALEDAAIGARIRLRRVSGPTTPLFGIVTAPGEAAPA